MYICNYTKNKTFYVKLSFFKLYFSKKKNVFNETFCYITQTLLKYLRFIISINCVKIHANIKKLTIKCKLEASALWTIK